MILNKTVDVFTGYIDRFGDMQIIRSAFSI